MHCRMKPGLYTGLPRSPLLNALENLHSRHSLTLGHRLKMKTTGFYAALAAWMLTASLGAQAAPPPSAQLEPLLLKALECNAKSSIWLQGATFKLDKLSITATEAGFSFDGELLTVMAGGVKQEKGRVKGTGAADGRITAMQTVDDVDEVREVRASCL